MITDTSKFVLMDGETKKDFIIRLCDLKEAYGFTWDDVCDIANKALGLNHTESAYRLQYKKYCSERVKPNVDPIPNIDPWEYSDEEDEMESELRSILTEKQRIKDERTQINALYRRMSREETLKDIAKDAVETVERDYPLLPKSPLKIKESSNEAILVLSDWHFGMEYDSPLNKYNPDICVERIAKLRDETIEKCKHNKVSKLTIVNLSDLISGRIHIQLRINSRYDVITQVIKVTEILTQLIDDLSNHFEINYYDVTDNHSRIESNKKEDMALETFTRITHWYLQDRMRNNKRVIVHENDYGPDVACINCLGYNFVGVHGDKPGDKLGRVVSSLTLMLEQHIDVVLTAHLHHFSADEVNNTLRISNGSLCGVDEYAEQLRLTNKPSQNLIIVSKDNPVECLYRIVL